MSDSSSSHDDVTASLQVEGVGAGAEIQLRRLVGREAIGQLFQFRVDVVCKQVGAVHVDDFMGASAAIVFERSGEVLRTVRGVIQDAEHAIDGADFDAFTVTVAPQIWMLGTVLASQVFLNKSIPSLINEKLEAAGIELGEGLHVCFADNKYAEREFVAQYKETELDFIFRWCEHLGISIVFNHDAGSSEQVWLVDEMADFPRRASSSLPFASRGETKGVYALSVKKSFAPHSVTLRDYNYRQPTFDLEVTSEATEAEGRFVMGGQWLFGEHYRTTGDGQRLADVRRGEASSAQLVYTGQSNCAELASGHIYRIDGCTHIDEELLVTEIEHELVQSVFSTDTDAVAYVARFTAVPVSGEYRPARRTPSPRIQGLQTGIVQAASTSGTDSTKAHIDAEGRYIIKFLFDTPDADRVIASAPVRMLQPTVGENYGMHFPLKPGVEVLLAFLDGNPDRPLVVGAVPNPTQPSPVTSSASTKSRLRASTGAILEFGGN